MSHLLSDLKFALRNLGQSKLFALVAIGSLALGIGANTAIFTLIDQLMLRLLPVRDPQQLVMIWTTGPHMGSNRGYRMASYPMYQDFQQKAVAFSSVFCQRDTPLSVNFAGRTERVQGNLVSGNYFQALGVKPALGRVFSPEEDDRVYKGHPVAVLSFPYWTTRFASDPSVIGQKMLINDYPMTIVGVSAVGFNGLDPANGVQVFVPVQMKPLMTPGWDDIGDRRSQWVQVFARLKPGFSLESAKASLQPLLSQILREEATQPALKDVSEYYRKRFLDRKVLVDSAGNGFSETRRTYSTALIALMCMVGLVLLIACFNVANLLIARAVARQKEIAVRLAIGASRWQVLRQLLVESLLLSVAGGAAGLFLAIAIIRALLHFLPAGDAPLMLRAEPDGRILAFNSALAIATGLFFGMAPAMQSLRVNLWNSLKDVVGAVVGGGGSVRFRKVLVTAQVAFSFLLLAGAGLFVRTLINLRETNTGFRDIDRVVTFQLDPALNGYSTARLQALYKQLLDSIRATPGVKAASFAVIPVLGGGEWDSTMSVEGHQNKDGEDLQAFMNAISTNYFKTLGVPIIEGRDFTDHDAGGRLSDRCPSCGAAVIVNRKFATHFFGNRSPIGRHLGFGQKPERLSLEIVGVTEDTLYEGPREGVRRQVFLPLMAVDYPAAVAFHVRTTMDPTSMYASLRQKVQAIDPAMPIYSMKTLGGQLDETLSTERLIAALSAAFGVLATVLAAIGLYGVMAFVVARRTKEIGLRMALGAPQSRVVWMVLRETMWLVGLGLAIGLPSALLLSRYVSTQLFGVRPADLGTAAAALLVLSVVAAGAGFLPARRASEIDPIKALRYE